MVTSAMIFPSVSEKRRPILAPRFAPRATGGYTKTFFSDRSVIKNDSFASFKNTQGISISIRDKTPSARLR